MGKGSTFIKKKILYLSRLRLGGRAIVAPGAPDEANNWSWGEVFFKGRVRTVGERESPVRGENFFDSG